MVATARFTIRAFVTFSDCSESNATKLSRESMSGLNQNRGQKVFNRGLYICAEGLHILKIRYNLHWFIVFHIQFEGLSPLMFPCLNLTPHTIAYLLILYLQSPYPKIANLIQIIYIVCRALGCFKAGSCERFAIDVVQISITHRTGYNWCEALG